ncbi:protein ALP1-like [Dendronephthya gigantea]|uniref:protein ALP1-like n=1 Tax=Dendronephthya gigantea TaxID=151771 RepID=UPI001068EC40|nr:protein ALP1-like [Dendronephthya gigantea]
MALSKTQLTLLLLLRSRRRRREKYLKRFWVRPIFQKRTQLSEFFTLVKELREEDHEGYFNYFRMLPDQFDYLHSLVKPLIQKSSKNRDSIGADERLALTLRYLASGDSPRSLSFSYRVSLTSVHRIISETCMAIWMVLQMKYVKAPSSPNDWIRIADEFERLWNFPNCCGAIDGKHIRIQAPPGSGSLYFNYKKWHSIVLLAVVSADYCFTLVDIGDNGRHSDGGIFQSSEIGVGMVTNLLGFPEARPLTGTSTVTPFLIVGDEAFPLMKNMMRPYPGKFLPENQQIFNYRLSRARRVVENAFGIAASRFRILRREIIAKPAKVEKIVMAVVALHNFLIMSEKQYPVGGRLYIPLGYVDSEDRNGHMVPGSWRESDEDNNGLSSIGRQGSNFYGKDASSVRNDLTQYFMTSEGSVSWQINHVTSTGDK